MSGKALSALHVVQERASPCMKAARPLRVRWKRTRDGNLGTALFRRKRPRALRSRPQLRWLLGLASQDGGDALGSAVPTHPDFRRDPLTP